MSSVLISLWMGLAICPVPLRPTVQTLQADFNLIVPSITLTGEGNSMCHPSLQKLAHAHNPFGRYGLIACHVQGEVWLLES